MDTKRDDELSLWIDLYGEKLIRLARAFTHNLQLAEDCVQEAFIRAYRNERVIDDPSKTFAWLARIVINECKRSRGKTAIRVDNYAEWSYAIAESAENSYIRHSTQRMIHQTVMDLPEKFKLPVILHYFEDVSLEEIAHIIGRPIGTVKSRLVRGRQRLQKMLLKEDEYSGYRGANPNRQTLS